MEKKLLQHINQFTLPHYKKNDAGHSIEHRDYVIRRSLNFAGKTSEAVNFDMAHTAGAYHDIGSHIDRKRHEEISAEMLASDKKLKTFFGANDILIMAEAVEDHRSSLEYTPRSIYGKILSTADKRTSLDDIFKTAYTLRIENNMPTDLIIEDSFKHFQKKFGINGYARTASYFDDPEYQNMLNEFMTLLNDEKLFLERYKKVNNLYSEQLNLQGK